MRAADRAALPHLRAGGSQGRDQGHQYRRHAGAGGGLGDRRAADAGAGRRARLQDRAHYYTLDGKEADVSKAKQNERFAVVLKITEAQPQFARVIVADYLPAGLRDRQSAARLLGRHRHARLDRGRREPVHTEFRDDRFTAAFERNATATPAVFTVAYVVRAVSPGRYVLPQAYVEDMYRPDRFGRTATGAVEVSAAK